MESTTGLPVLLHPAPRLVRHKVIRPPRPPVVQLSLAYGLIARVWWPTATSGRGLICPAGRFLSNSEDGPLSDCAVRVPENEKLKEIVQLQASLWRTAQHLPAGAERENALREIGSFQRRMTALIRRRWQRDLSWDRKLRILKLESRAGKQGEQGSLA